MASIALAALFRRMRSSSSGSHFSGCSVNVGFSSVSNARSRGNAGFDLGASSLSNVMAEQRTSSQGSSSSAINVGMPATSSDQPASSWENLAISTSAQTASPRTYLLESRHASYKGAM